MRRRASDVRQALLFADLVPANTDVEKPERPAHAGRGTGRLLDRIAELERRLLAEEEAGIIMQQALDDIADPLMFQPERFYHPEQARCRGWHTGDCTHACGQEYMKAKEHARAQSSAAKERREAILSGASVAELDGILDDGEGGAA